MSGLGCERWRWKLGGTCEVRQILFLPLGIFDSYVSLIQNKIFFGTLRRISDLTDLAVTSWAFSCLLNPGLWYILVDESSYVFGRWYVRRKPQRKNSKLPPNDMY